MSNLTDSNDALKNAFLTSTIDGDKNIAVKAEDLPQGGGINFKEHYFEPQVGSTYLIKFLPNPGNEPIIHRSVYKDLPDPERKGKTFHYVSSGNAKTCKALDLFFALNADKKNGDAVADQKIKKYLGKTNQGCCKIQVLQSPVAEEVGMVRMFQFATFGPNATVANLLNLKLNPTAQQIQQGFEKEDIFNIFSSSVMSIVCEEATYDGIKGRDFTKSTWAPKKFGAIAKLEDGTTFQFNEKSLVNGKVIPEAVPAFNAFVKLVLDEKYDIYNYFAYKVVDDPRNSKETNDYLKSVFAKVDEICDVIKNSSLTEIAAYGKAESKSDSTKADKAKDVMADSIPEELSGSVMTAANETVKKETKQAKEKVEAPKADAEGDVSDVLNA